MKPLCGIDEAGRGCIAGPMALAGVVLTQPIAGITDSKKLTSVAREALYAQITATCPHHIILFDASTLDCIGISHALQRGLEELASYFEGHPLLFDGNTTYGVLGIQTQIKADATVAAVAAASIVAKVARDRALLEAAAAYPMFAFAQHKGYGTAAHLRELARHGYTPLHRRSFRIKGWDLGAASQ